MSEPFSIEADPLGSGECVVVADNEPGAGGANACPAQPQAPRFDDGKSEQAFRTIGEVAKALAIRPHVLRYWEDQFPMLRPVKRSGGRRYYRQEDIRLVETIDRLVHREGYTLRGARQKLEEEGKKAKRSVVRAPATPAGSAAAQGAGLTAIPQTSSSPDDFRARLLAIRTGLAQALND